MKAAYEAEDEEYDRYSEHTTEQVIKGKEEVARNLYFLSKIEKYFLF